MRIYTKKDMALRLSKFEPITESGCWIWLGAVDKDAYGRMRGSEDGKIIFQFAHRASYEYYISKIRTGKHICHHCDVPSCINPSHLYEGDPATNGYDKAIRKRARTRPRFGQDNPMSKTNRLKREFLK